MSRSGYTGDDGDDTPPVFRQQFPRYSSDWAKGGPIIDRELITLVKFDGGWTATRELFYTYIDESLPFAGRSGAQGETGPTALIAAMRAYVASAFGPEVEIEPAQGSA